MNWECATLTELNTIIAWDEFEHCDVTTTDKWQAAHEIVRRQQFARKPHRMNQQKVKATYPK